MDKILAATIIEMFNDGDEQLDTIDDGDWVEDGKYSHCETIVEYRGKTYQIDQSRSGSYFSDYYYEDPEVHEVVRKEETKVVVTWVAV